MTLSDHLQTWILWLTYLPILVCSIMGSGITVYKWLQLRRPFVPSNAALQDAAGLSDTFPLYDADGKSLGAWHLSYLPLLAEGSRAQNTIVGFDRADGARRWRRTAGQRRKSSCDKTSSEKSARSTGCAPGMCYSPL